MEYIRILGPNHLIYIAILLFFTFLLFNFQSNVEHHREKLSKLIFIISLAQQILLYGSYVLLGEFTLEESLPLHISRINTILGLIFLVTKSHKLFNIITYFSVFAWLSFLVPSKIEPITHPRGVSFLINHVITLLLPYYGLIAYKMTLKTTYRPTIIKYFLIYFVIVAIVNPFVNGNYFYLKDKPIFPTTPNIIYYPAAVVASILLFFIIEKIFLTIQKRSLKNNPPETN